MHFRKGISENVEESPSCNNKDKEKFCALLPNRNFSFDIMKTSSSSKNSLFQTKNKSKNKNNNLNLSSEFPLSINQVNQLMPSEQNIYMKKMEKMENIKKMKINKMPKELNVIKENGQISDKNYKHHNKSNILNKNILLKENYQLNSNEESYTNNLMDNLHNFKASTSKVFSPNYRNSRTINRSTHRSLNERWIKRQNDYQLIKRRKMKMLENEILVNELHSCTFEPSINNSNQDLNYRTADQFFDDQMKYLELKNKKVIETNEMKKIQEINTCRPPIISAKAKVISEEMKHNVNSYFSIPVCRRLASTSSYKEQYLSNDKIQHKNNISQDFTYHPKINKRSKSLIREDKAFKLLYKDAIKRIEMKDKAKLDISQEESKEMNKSFVLPKSHKYLFTRFSKEYNEAFDKVSKNSQKINYIQTIRALTLLGFIDIKKTNRKNSNDKFLIYDIWRILKGEELSGINKRNLLIFLLIVLGYYSDSMNMNINKGITIKNNNICPKYYLIEENKLEKNEKNEDESINCIGVIDPSTNNLLISKSEAQKIHKYFLPFLKNKMKKYQEDKEYLKLREAKENHNPIINVESKFLANKFKEKTLKSISSKIGMEIKPTSITHEDFLLIKGLEYESNNKTKFSLNTHRNNNKIQTINNDKLSPNSSRNYHSYYKAHDIKMSKPKIRLYDKQSSDIEYEKSKNECTFHPSIKETTNNWMTSRVKKFSNRKKKNI